MAEEAKGAESAAADVAGEAKEEAVRVEEDEDYRADVRGMSATAWLRQRFGMVCLPQHCCVFALTWQAGRAQVPSDATGWFRAGVGFYNKGWYHQAIECLRSAVRLDVEHVSTAQCLHAAPGHRTCSPHSRLV